VGTREPDVGPAFWGFTGTESWAKTASILPATTRNIPIKIKRLIILRVLRANSPHERHEMLGYLC
jgi:hypothetical protein